MQAKPWRFLARLLVYFCLTFALWQLLAPAYTQVLLYASRAGLWLTELSTDPLWHGGTTLVSRGTAIFYSHRGFASFQPPIPPQGIPAEWVMANLILLVPLMLATPAPSWRARFTRLALALAIALLLQVTDIIVSIKAFYSNVFEGYWGPFAARTYRFLDGFIQSWDTQLFPFAIWAGIHFRQLTGLRAAAGSERAAPMPRAERRRTKRGKR
jgi:hypothetical protein